MSNELKIRMMNKKPRTIKISYNSFEIRKFVQLSLTREKKKLSRSSYNMALIHSTNRGVSNQGLRYVTYQSTFSIESDILVKWSENLGDQENMYKWKTFRLLDVICDRCCKLFFLS